MPDANEFPIDIPFLKEALEVACSPTPPKEVIDEAKLKAAMEVLERVSSLAGLIERWTEKGTHPDVMVE